MMGQGEYDRVSVAPPCETCSQSERGVSHSFALGHDWRAGRLFPHRCHVGDIGSEALALAAASFEDRLGPLDRSIPDLVVGDQVGRVAYLEAHVEGDQSLVVGERSVPGEGRLEEVVVGGIGKQFRSLRFAEIGKVPSHHDPIDLHVSTVPAGATGRAQIHGHPHEPHDPAGDRAVASNSPPSRRFATVETWGANVPVRTSLRSRPHVRAVRAADRGAASQVVHHGRVGRVRVRTVHRGVERGDPVGDRPRRRAALRQGRGPCLDRGHRMCPDRRDRRAARRRRGGAPIVRRVDAVADRRVAHQRSHRTLRRTAGQLAPPPEPRTARWPEPASTSRRRSV